MVKDHPLIRFLLLVFNSDFPATDSESEERKDTKRERRIWEERRKRDMNGEFK